MKTQQSIALGFTLALIALACGTTGNYNPDQDVPDLLQCREKYGREGDEVYLAEKEYGASGRRCTDGEYHG